MLTRLVIRNFKTFADVDIELGDRVVFVGPNNSGKTSALQALALWNAGVRRWVEKRGAEEVSKERSGVTINRRDLIALPIPSSNLLWRNLHVREGVKIGDKAGTRNILIDIEVEGTAKGEPWKTSMEFDYANEESFYCRSKVGEEGARVAVPAAAAGVKLAFLPPMSGLASNETVLTEGAIAVRIGEGRTAEVLRNLCWQAFQAADKSPWESIKSHMRDLFGISLADPLHVPERGELTMEFRSGGIDLDLSASGRGQQQMLLLLAHMAANPGSVLLLDEPDAHLEILRQRQMYDVLAAMATKTGSQIIAASHSEVLLNEAADRDIVVAFVGKPHRIDDRGTQVVKALKEIGFDQYLQAEQTGWVLYLEGSTDLAILRAFAETLGHPVKRHLDRPFVHYVSDQPPAVKNHFHGLREAKPDLVGIAVFDRLPSPVASDPYLHQAMWRRNEIENYLTTRDVLVSYARDFAARESGAPLFAESTAVRMETAIDDVAGALEKLGKADPFGPDLKVSTEFLDPVFKAFFRSICLPEATMRKTDYHMLARFVPLEAISPDVVEILDRIHDVAERAIPRT
jgi:ABC-type branched-subunit amino acid transport system ATPase component